MNPNRKNIIYHKVKDLLARQRVAAPPVDVEGIARTLGIFIRKTPTDNDVSGFLLKQGDASVIGVNALHHPNRQRFTIAHEIGHFMLHDFDEVHVDKFILKLRDKASSKGELREEVEANRFAAELLMPSQLLEQELSLVAVSDLLDDSGMQRLAKRFQVSVHAMSNRLTSLGYIAPAELG